MQSPFWKLTAILIIIVFVFFLIIPIAKIMVGSFQTEEEGPFTLKNYRDFAAYRSYWRSFFNSVFVGLASALTTILVGVPLGFIVSRWNVPGKPLIITLSTLPLMLPSFISAFVWVILLGRQGILTHFVRSIGIPFESIYGYFGLIFVFTFQLYPYVFLMTLSAFSTIDESVEEAAKILGSGPLRTFITVSFPLVMPSILSGALLVFMTSVENFGVPMIIGEQMPILAVQAYVQFTSEVGQHPGMAHTMGLILILITMTSLVAQRHYLAKRNFIQSARGRPLVKELSPFKRFTAASYCYVIVLFALIPFFVAMVISFMEMRGPVIHPNFSMQSYIYAFGRSARPIFNSYFLATVATAVSVLIGVPAGYILTRYQRSAYSGALDIVIMLPFVVAGTVLGIALTIAFNKGILILTGTWMILALSYTIRKMPFVARSSSSILYQIDPALEEASISLGVSPMKTFFKVTVRLMLGGILAGAILSWVTIISELSSTIVLYPPGWSTMIVEMFQGVISDDMGTASAFAAILILSTIIPLLFITRYLRGEQTSIL
jgi:iron(III) transport system permease protein